MMRSKLSDQHDRPGGPFRIDAFLDRIAPAVRPGYAALPNLRDLLGDMLAQALAVWPQLSLGADDFLAFLAERLPGELAPEEALGGLHVTDLFLACACARTDRRALEAFERDYALEIARGLSSFAGDEVRGDDFKQEVRHKLFIGKPPAGPKIAEYSGRGSLRRWVRITARRTYIDLMRARQREPEVLLGDDIVSERASEMDPELVYVKERYRQEFRTAFTAALATLTTRQRNILRHHFVHRLRFDEIAGIYRVHRATVARWIADARTQLLERTRAVLRDQLMVEGEEFESIMRLIQSDLDVTVSRLLKRPSL
jgi:RNA polymerase sigma-70 factor, ECF subfamily